MVMDMNDRRHRQLAASSAGPTVERLRADGHDVLGLDLGGDAGAGSPRVDLSDYGQTLDALLGVDGPPRRPRRRRAPRRDPGERARA